MKSPIYIEGFPFDASIEHFSFGSFDPYHKITDMAELRKLSQFEDLRSATFVETGLNDTGLAHVCRLTSIENLNLQATEISNEGLRNLANLPHLKHLRLKENPQLTNDCVPFLLNLDSLLDLEIQETPIDQEGIKQLVGLQGLTDLCLDVGAGNFTYDVLVEVSTQMPNCTILAKGRGEFSRGQFEGDWE